jgi:hypothetical protein
MDERRGEMAQDLTQYVLKVKSLLSGDSTDKEREIAEVAMRVIGIAIDSDKEAEEAMARSARAMERAEKAVAVAVKADAKRKALLAENDRLSAHATANCTAAALKMAKKTDVNTTSQSSE